MDISLVIIIGLPVLYMTGSLRKIVADADVGGRCFVLYFACTAVLSFLPEVNISQNVSLNIAGAFFCIAPAVYLIFKKGYFFSFYFVFTLVTLLGVIFSLVFSTYTLSYLPYIKSGIVALIAVVCFKKRAPVFVPVLMGVFSMAESLMLLLTGMYMTALFDSVNTACVSIVFSLFAVSLFRKRKKGRHERRRGKDLGPVAPQHNKG